MGEDVHSSTKRRAEFARELQGHHKDPEATYQLAVKLTHFNVDVCDGASLTIGRHHQAAQTVAASSDMARDADKAQYEAGEGPCLDATRDDRVVYSPDLRDETRWPRWAPDVVERTGVHSVLAFRLYTHSTSFGALNLYSRTPDAFDKDARDEGLAIACHIAIAVAAAHEIDDLTNGLDSRTVIGQATGILMGRFNLTPEAAFNALARYSSTSNVKLREVAAEIVRTGILPRVNSPALIAKAAAHGIDSGGDRPLKE